MLDDNLAAAIAEMPVAATWTPPDGSGALSFDVMPADDQATNIFAATNFLLEIKRLVRVRIASFAGKVARAELLLSAGNDLFTLDGEQYRIVSVKRGDDQVSWHLGLASPKK